MSKINKTTITNIIIFTLGIVAIVAFAMIATVTAFKPRAAGAYFYGGSYYSDANSPGYTGGTGTVGTYSNNQYNNNQYPIYNTQPQQVQPTIVYVTTPTKTTTINRTIVQKSATNSASTTKATPQAEGASTTSDYGASQLTSNALAGSNGFLPSGLIQWLFVFIFILLAIIAYRSISAKEKYNAQPMKHA